MCSIAGGGNVKQKLEIMKHRSPDGYSVVGNVGMGRLAIVDLKSKGLYPFVDGKYTICFNGELYNYRDIRFDLMMKGYTFRTNSDTEVVLKAYQQWGIQGCLDKFNGMFAFAIVHDDVTVLARDIAGQKPLYYSEDPFEFASEAKALPESAKELPPAHYALWDGKRLKVAKWWHFKPYKRKITFNQAVKELEELLEDAVRIRIPEVQPGRHQGNSYRIPYALYFSGGIDSTLISTFSDFPSQRRITYNEKDNNKEVFLKEAPDIYYHLDYPVRSFSPFGLWTLAKRAQKRSYKIVISGEGADELFGGYVRFIPNWLNYQAQKEYPSYKKLFPYDPDMEWKEFQGNLRELLRMGDRMAMAHGIENRCPFLDRRIIEFAFSLPPEIKYDGFHGKHILRELLKKRKPDYKFKEKHGLFIPVNEWIGAESFDKEAYVKWQKSL